MVPSLIQWDSTRHPSHVLPETGLALKALKGWHPQADIVAQQLQWLGAAQLIALENTDGAPALAADIETPSGLRTLR